MDREDVGEEIEGGGRRDQRRGRSGGKKRRVAEVWFRQGWTGGLVGSRASERGCKKCLLVKIG